MGFWLRLLAVLLAVGEPLGIALEAARILPTLADREPAVSVLLGARLAIAGLAVAAGLALWNRRPHAIALARLALVSSAAGSLFRLLTPILPSNRPPGTTLPLAVAVILYYAAWLVYLSATKVR